MYTHEYSDKKFDSYEACRDDLMENIDEEDIARHLDLTVPEIISAFLRKIVYNLRYISLCRNLSKRCDKIRLDIRANF